MATSVVPALLPRPTLLFEQRISETGSYSFGGSTSYNFFLLRVEGNLSNVFTAFAPVGLPITAHVGTTSIFAEVTLTISLGASNAVVVSAFSSGTWTSALVQIWGIKL